MDHRSILGDRDTHTLWKEVDKDEKYSIVTTDILTL